MVQQVLVDHPLLLIQVPGELIRDVDLVVLVLDLAELFQCHAHAFKHLVELGSVDDYLAVFLGLFEGHDELAQFIFGHDLEDGLDFVASL